MHVVNLPSVYSVCILMYIPYSMYVHYSDVLYLNMESVCTFTLCLCDEYILMSNTTHIHTLMYVFFYGRFLRMV